MSKNDDIIYNFSEFGRKLNNIGICMFLSLFIPFIPSLLILIFLNGALKNIKNILYQMSDKHLFEFRSKIINAYIVTLFAIFLLTAGIISLIFGLIFMPIFIALYSLIPIIMGLLLLICSAVFEMKAWENLTMFFKEHSDMFPESILNDAIEGAEKLRTGNLLMALAFLVITGIIGWIFQVMGYFKLAELKNLTHQQSTSQSKVAIAQPPIQTIRGSTENYCPHCGSKVLKNKNFCIECGSQIS